MILNINTEIDTNAEKELKDEHLEKLIEAYNVLPDGETLYVYLSSAGGSRSVSDPMLNLINENNLRTKLIGYNILCSAAFELFFKAKCDKYFIGGIRGMCHQNIMDIKHNEFGIVKDAENMENVDLLQNYCRNSTKQLCEQLQMTPQEIADIESGKDVWFTTDRMNEFLKINIKTKI